MTCDVGKMLHLRLRITYVHDDVRVLVRFVSLRENNARSCKIAFQKKRVRETKQLFGLFISVSNSRFQPMKPTGVVHIENVYIKDNDKLVQSSWL